MKIFQINLLKFNTPNSGQKIDNVSRCENSSSPLMMSPRLEKDTVTFSGRIPSIVTPTMEDLINRTKAVDVLRYNILRLAKHDVPCPVCGGLMFDSEKSVTFDKKLLQCKNPTEILKCIEVYSKYLHPVESEILKMMKQDNLYHPERTLFEMLKRRLPRAEKRIVQHQSKIFSNIGLLSRKLPEEMRLNVQNLLNDSFDRILDPRETSRFSRQIFIYKLKNAIIPDTEKNKLREKLKIEFISKHSMSEENFESNMASYVETKLKVAISLWKVYTSNQMAILTEAYKLSKAYNNVDAFIVKYAKRDYKGADPDYKIATRMLNNSLATVEHVVAQSNRGTTEPKNLSLECAACNNGRGNDSILKQIEDNPNMPVNYRRFMKRLCDLHLQNIVEKSYITQLNKTYKRQSCGILDADLSIMNKRSNKKQKILYIQSGITPTKAERRQARKMKLKLKAHKNNRNKI